MKFVTALLLVALNSVNADVLAASFAFVLIDCIKTFHFDLTHGPIERSLS
jgi:hypothetical protein